MKSVDADKKTFVIGTVLFGGYVVLFFVLPDDATVIGVPKKIALVLVCLAFCAQSYIYLKSVFKRK